MRVTFFNSNLNYCNWAEGSHQAHLSSSHIPISLSFQLVLPFFCYFFHLFINCFTSWFVVSLFFTACFVSFPVFWCFVLSRLCCSISFFLYFFYNIVKLFILFSCTLFLLVYDTFSLLSSSSLFSFVHWVCSFLSLHHRFLFPFPLLFTYF